MADYNCICTRCGLRMYAGNTQTDLFYPHQFGELPEVERVMRLQEVKG